MKKPIVITATTKPNGAWRCWLEVGQFQHTSSEQPVWKPSEVRYLQKDARLTFERKYDGSGNSKRIHWTITLPADYPETVLCKSGDSRTEDTVIWSPPTPLQEPRIVVYDLEILRAIPPTNDTERIPGIVYCNGWEDHEYMGISVIGVFDSTFGRLRVFCQDTFPEFQEVINNADVVIGFNSITFDDRVCAANGISVTTTYDLRRELLKVRGLDPFPPTEVYNGEQSRLYKGGLNDFAVANNIGGKIGHGAIAPIDWQQGRYGKVIDYCLHDTFLTWGLAQMVQNNVPIYDPITNQSYTLPAFS